MTQPRFPPVLLALSLSACASPTTPAPLDVVEVTIAEVQEAILSGATTCRMVVRAHLDRIAAYEERLNAITVLNPRALQRADSIDACS